jgi:hypothetical protein
MMLFVSIYGCNSDITEPVKEWYVKHTLLDQKIERDSITGNFIITDIILFHIKYEYKDMTDSEMDKYVDEVYKKYSYYVEADTCNLFVSVNVEPTLVGSEQYYKWLNEPF